MLNHRNSRLHVDGITLWQKKVRGTGIQSSSLSTRLLLKRTPGLRKVQLKFCHQLPRQKFPHRVLLTAHLFKVTSLSLHFRAPFPFHRQIWLEGDLSGLSWSQLVLEEEHYLIKITRILSLWLSIISPEDTLGPTATLLNPVEQHSSFAIEILLPHRSSRARDESFLTSAT